jgi:hypothetical protein
MIGQHYGRDRDGDRKSNNTHNGSFHHYSFNVPSNAVFSGAE